MMIYLKRCRYSIAALLISILITFIAGGNALAVPDGIVDNSDPEFSVTGIWGTALRTVLPGVYGADFRYHAGNTGNTTIHHPRNNKAIWNAELTGGPGYYRVKIRYPACPLLATNAPFTINHNGESETILVDQRRNGGKWLNPGIYYFADDGTENITLSDNADSWVVADVVSFTPTSPPPPPDGIVDNFDPKFSLTGRWPTSSNTNNTNKVPRFFGIDFRYHATGDGTETVRWDTELINGSGVYEVSVWYPISAKLATNAAYTINHNNISDTVMINQSKNGGQWVSLGSYEFADDATENITLSDNADSWVVADAVRFELCLIPHIDSVDPSSGSANSDTDITISGYNFTPDAKVFLNGGGPYITGSVDTPGFAIEVYISGSYAYVTDGTSGLHVIDISDAASPYIVGSVDTPGSAIGVYISDSYAYVGDLYSGLQVIDISDAASPYIVGSVDTPDVALKVYISGSYAYVSGGNFLHVIDISDPANPYIVGSVDILRLALNVYISGSYAYVTDKYSGLHVIDISDAANPYIVGSVDTPDYAIGVYISGSYAYVTDRESKYSGLLVIDISDPANPYIVGSVDTPSYANDVFVSGNHAYVADWGSGLLVIDISDPANPYIVDSIDTPGFAADVYISGNHAYVAEGYLGLQIIDVSVPSSPSIQLDINVIDSTTITATVPANLRPGVYYIIVINPGEGRDILRNGFEVF